MYKHIAYIQFPCDSALVNPLWEYSSVHTISFRETRDSRIWLIGYNSEKISQTRDSFITWLILQLSCVIHVGLLDERKEVHKGLFDVSEKGTSTFFRMIEFISVWWKRDCEEVICRLLWNIEGNFVQHLLIVVSSCSDLGQLGFRGKGNSTLKFGNSLLIGTT